MEGHAVKPPVGEEVSLAVHLSIIIPAYNEEQRIAKSLQTILAYLRQQPYPAEVIVVDDGSRDATGEAVRPFRGGVPPVHLLANGRNRGKGFSVRHGFFQARGTYLLFSDADLSTPIEEVERLLAALQHSADIAIGSRALPDSRVEVHQPWYRESMGQFYNLLVQTLAVPGIHDTQCGFKCFRREAAQAICQRMSSERFGFDVEMLYLGRKLGYRVCEVPVVWRHSPQTRVRVGRDAVSMFIDLLRVRWHDIRHRYDVPRQQTEQPQPCTSGALLPNSVPVAGVERCRRSEGQG
jgi:dolichyl-phosphate beta-glucosyltransferase